MAAATVASAALSANASSNAANTAAGSSYLANQMQQQMFNTINAQQAPYRQAGYTALNQLGQLTGPGGYMSQPFTAADLNSYLAPNYQWQLGQGLGALNNQLNTTGGVNSGNTLKAIQDYAQNYAGNAYQNAFNNYQTQQGNIFNRLSDIAALGQGANQITAKTGTTTAANAGQAMQNAGQAAAAGQIGQANAISGGLNNLASLYTMQQMGLLR